MEAAAAARGGGATRGAGGKRSDNQRPTWSTHSALFLFLFFYCLKGSSSSSCGSNLWPRHASPRPEHYLCIEITSHLFIAANATADLYLPRIPPLLLPTYAAEAVRLRLRLRLCLR